MVDLHCSEHASIALTQAAREHSGELRLVAIGPLTNIAVALKLEPDLPNLLHSITIMGGCDGGGNVTPTAEFNFHCDPEAAQAVSINATLKGSCLCLHGFELSI